MHSPKRLKITDVNPHLICVLCGGYYIDATTVIECLHSFCKSCIVKYLEKNKYCPICDVQIHKTTPLLSIRPDKTLQNIVYKLVPSLFKNEMQRRVDFYEKHPESLPPSPEQRGEVTETTPIFFPDELLIVCLEYQDNQALHQMKRYLHCPAALPISHLIKLIKGKFSLNAKHQVHIFFKDDPLMEHITLMDIAYTYQCRRKTPIHLTYRILELKKKKIRIVNSEPQKEVKEDKHPEKEWKEVQLQISENGVMSVRNVESCECSPIPAVEAPPVYSPCMMTSGNHLNHSSTTTSSAVVPQSTPNSHQSAALVHPDVNTAGSVPVSVASESVREVNSPSKVNKPPPSVNTPPIYSAASTSASSTETMVSSTASKVSTPMVTTTAPTASPVVTNETSVSTSSDLQTTYDDNILAPAPMTDSSPALSTSQTGASPGPTKEPPPITPQPTLSSAEPSSTSTSSLPPSTAPTLLSSMPPLLSAASSAKSVTSHSTSILSTSVSLPHTISTSVPSSLVSHSVVSTLSPSLMSHPPISITSPSVSLAGFPSPSLPTSPTVVTPHSVMSNLPSFPQGSIGGTVTTVAGMKPSTNLVPANYPIMSTCRSQTEPIVSVSKVSKDQVRKPNNVIEMNKLSISRVPPGGMKEKGENLNKIVNKLSPNERVIGNTSVTIRPVTNSPNQQSKMYPLSKPSGLQSPPTTANKERPSQVRYKTLRTSTKPWNPSIDRSTMLMKQNSDPNKPFRFFKMRNNMPRFLGNPASGVKPLYACPEEPVVPNSPQNKQKLTLLKVDPKTIPTSSMPRSPTKQPPPYTPGSPKLSKPPSYSDPKSFMNPRMPTPAHTGTFLPPNPYHLLYSGYPGFSHDATNRMLSPELIRSMCAYHPSLPPSIGMLFNPMHPIPPRPQDGFKPESTPAVQRIPPSKTESPSPKPAEDKRYPSPVSISENKKLTPPPMSPKDTEKSLPAHQEAPPKVNSSSNVENPSQDSPAEVKDNNSETTNAKHNSEDSNLVKINCDDININNNNNNNSKESPPSQPSENLANKSQ